MRAIRTGFLCPHGQYRLHSPDHHPLRVRNEELFLNLIRLKGNLNLEILSRPEALSSGLAVLRVPFDA